MPTHGAAAGLVNGVEAALENVSLLADPSALWAMGLVFTLAGFVKGVVGLGLPTVCLALLSVLTDLPSAMALMLVPSFVTNLWQASVGGHALAAGKGLAGDRGDGGISRFFH